MDVKLKVQTGKHAGKMIPLVGPQFLIGRAEDCQLRAGSDLISRHHCAFLLRESYVGIKDFDSRNGTLVNGEPISGERELKAGDELKIGPLEFEVVIEYAEKAKKRPPVKDLSDMASRTAAPADAGNVEENINDWLGDPDTPKSGAWSAADTRAVDLKNADTVSLTPPEKEKEKDKQPTQTPGKLPKVEAPGTKDSREAAAATLRRLSQRR